jgi:hypothetical protein
MTMRKILCLLSVSVLSVTIASPVEAVVRPAKPAKVSDFNGDGRQDIVVGYTGLTVRGRKAAGGVAVFTGKKRKVLTRDTAGVPGRSRSRERFGGTLVSADFNRDGYADLLVGLNREGIVLYGSRAGLTGRGAKAISWNVKAVRKGPGGTLGRPLAGGLQATSGDYDSDGYADVALRPGGDSRGILVLRGGGKGLRPAGAVRLTNGYRSFGAGLKSGDVTGDGIADLVAGNEAATGDHRFTVIPGRRRAGLDLPRSRHWTVSAPRLPGMAVGDLNGDRKADFVRNDEKGVVIRLSRGGSFGPDQLTALDQGNGDAALGTFAIGDVNGDGRGDLAFTRAAAIYQWVELYPGTATGLGARRIGSFGGSTEAESWGGQLYFENAVGDSRADLLITVADAYGGGPRIAVQSAGRTASLFLTAPRGSEYGGSLLSG